MVLHSSNFGETKLTVTFYLACPPYCANVVTTVEVLDFIK
jgi:hypothetical protein